MKYPYVAPGDWNLICDVCGKKIKASESRHRWDGLIVCTEDWEPRHESEFFNISKRNESVPFTRPEAIDTYVPEACPNGGTFAIAGVGIAGCAIAGLDAGGAFIPE
jgi:hypothetical protein